MRTRRPVRAWGGTAVRGAGVYLDQKLARRRGVSPRWMPLLYLEVTRECNLSCAMCGYPEGYPVQGAELTTDDIRAILDDAVDQLGTQLVSFGGGEPLLRTDFFELLEHADRRGLSIHVNTNGTRVDARCADLLARCAKLAVFVSLDHPRPVANDAIRGRGVFQRCEAAIALLRERAPAVHVGINTLVGGHNLGQLNEMVDLARRWGVHSIKFVPLHQNLAHRWNPRPQPAQMLVDDGRIDSLAAELSEAARRARAAGLVTSSRAFVRWMPHYHRGLRPPLPCAAGFVYGNIDPCGQLFPCYDHMEPVDVREQGLVAAWRSPAMQRMRAGVRSCEARCWNSGNAEPSLRLSLRNTIADPSQLLSDLETFVR